MEVDGGAGGSNGAAEGNLVATIDIDPVASADGSRKVYRPLRLVLNHASLIIGCLKPNPSRDRGKRCSAKDGTTINKKADTPIATLLNSSSRGKVQVPIVGLQGNRSVDRVNDSPEV